MATVAKKVKLKNTSGGIVICCQLRWKPGQEMEIDGQKYTESVKKLVADGKLIEVK